MPLDGSGGSNVHTQVSNFDTNAVRLADETRLQWATCDDTADAPHFTVS